jgi:hypothetical protein
LLGRDGAHLLAALGVFAVSFVVAYWADRTAIEAGTFAFAAVAAFAALALLLGARARDRRTESMARALDELADVQRRAVAEADAERPEPSLLLLVRENTGVQRARIEQMRPRPLDIEQAVAHERTLALRTLPPVKTPIAGSLKIYREPSEHDRNGFRDQVARYAASLRETLERYDTYRAERALLVRGRFRFENQSRRTAHNVTVRAYFPDPFEIVREALEPPALPKRPTFHAKRAGLAALVGGDSRRNTPPEASIRSREGTAPRVVGNVSRPRYRQGSAIVEVSVGRLQQSLPADMAEEDCWVLRLPRSGEYRIPWEIASDDLEEPARGELWLEVVERLDDTPIRSVKELLEEEEAAAHHALR